MSRDVALMLEAITLKTKSVTDQLVSICIVICFRIDFLAHFLKNTVPVSGLVVMLYNGNAHSNGADVEPGRSVEILHRTNRTNRTNRP